MSPWLLILTALFSTAGGPAGANEPGIPATSVGPTSPEEAELLWKDGHAALERGKFQEAANDFQRLVDRYPAYPGSIKAHLELGRARMELHEYAKARTALKYYITGAGSENLPDTQRARIWLGRAYLALQKPEEAFLNSVEVEKHPAPPALQAEALLLRAEAQLSLGQESRASETLISASEAIQKAGIPTLAPEAKWLEVQIKARECARYPSPGLLDEAQVRNQLDRRGSCMMQTLLVMGQEIELGEEVWSSKAGEAVADAFRNYSFACAHPPDPPPIQPRNRTTTQLKKYRQELAANLTTGCKKVVRQALDTLGAWKLSGKPLRKLEKDLRDTLEKLGNKG